MPTVRRITRPWEHKPAQNTPVANQGRSNPNRDIYGSQRWRKLSEAYRNQHPNCVACERNKKFTIGKVVDHIVSINRGGDPWDESNWQVLCLACHNAKSARERHGKV